MKGAVGVIDFESITQRIQRGFAAGVQLLGKAQGVDHAGDLCAKTALPQQ